ncbi:hypothetical protein [Corynebacterium lubricantis]|uniref:hypothetical protein n=1 Tax=Corynebacterium lubricantis TaxID=541095 RepID=UPI000364883F|nr:hypothetical protein [Corynebacterium lubricantis]
MELEDIDWQKIQVVEGDEGLLIFGSESDLAELEESAGFELRRPSPQTLQRASNLFGSLSTLQEQSGRWLKLDDESFELIKKSKVRDVSSGVLRKGDLGVAGNAGEIVKQLAFQKATLLTPAAPAAAAALIAQEAIEVALDEITDYLETIDEKIDRLIEQRRVDSLSSFNSIRAALLEAQRIYENTGTVSDTTWSKIAGVGIQLQRIQEDALAQLGVVRDGVAKKVRNTAKLGGAYEDAVEQVQFWLQLLAQGIALQDSFFVLELARVADYENEHLDGHVQGIRQARQERIQEQGEILSQIQEQLLASAELSRAEKLQHPRAALRVNDNANRIQETFDQFSEHVEVELASGGVLEWEPWRVTARELVGDVTDSVNTLRKSTQDKVAALPAAVKKRREDSLLEKAEKIKAKRESEPHSED